MSFPELIERLKALPVDEKRKESNGYLELVLSARHLNHLYPILEQYFGVPFKPPGIEPTSQAESYARRYGGIRKHQTLYFIQNNGTASCAMIWPWSDGSRSTLKVAYGALEVIKA